MQSLEPVAQFDSTQNRFLPAPIELGPGADQVFLVFYGTGLRYRSKYKERAEASVRLTVVELLAPHKPRNGAEGEEGD